MERRERDEHAALLVDQDGRSQSRTTLQFSPRVSLKPGRRISRTSGNAHVDRQTDRQIVSQNNRADAGSTEFPEGKFPKEFLMYRQGYGAGGNQANPYGAGYGAGGYGNAGAPQGGYGGPPNPSGFNPTGDSADNNKKAGNDPLLALIRWFKARSDKERTGVVGLAALAALVLFYLVVEDHDTLFVLSEIIHFVGIAVLGFKLIKQQNSAGLSLGSQELTLVFLFLRMFCSLVMEYGRC